MIKHQKLFYVILNYLNPNNLRGTYIVKIIIIACLRFKLLNKTQLLIDQSTPITSNRKNTKEKVNKN